LPDLAALPPAGLSPIVPVALATRVTGLPASPFIVRSVFAPWSVLPDRSGYCSTRVLQLFTALKQLVLLALQPATIHCSVPRGAGDYRKRFICGHSLPACAGQTTSRKRPLHRLRIAPCSLCGLPNGHPHHLCPAPLLTPDGAVHRCCPAFSCVTASIRLAVPGLPFRPEPERFFPCAGLTPLLRSLLRPCGRCLLRIFSACRQ